MPLVFPEGFLFGVATSAHQVEGNNRNNDWWEWEERGRVPYRSGLACNHWELYPRDIELMSKLGVRAYRFSVEWSRIYPSRGSEDPSALERYHDIVRELLRHAIEPVVTLHHFTNPRWFVELGGWLREENLRYFIDYVDVVVSELREVRLWVTVNEPVINAVTGYLQGIWPPGLRSPLKAGRFLVNIYKAHVEAASIVRERGGLAGLAKHLIDFRASRGLLGGVAFRRVEDLVNWSFLDAMWTGTLRLPLGRARVPTLEPSFIGVNYYTCMEAGFSWKPSTLFLDVRPVKTGEPTTMGYHSCPHSLYRVLVRLWERYGKPIYVTENGIATPDDEARVRFIVRHLQCLHKALEEGVDVEGYFYWSLMDNFEWDKGYTQKFGLVEVDPETLERRPRRSAYIYGAIARSRSASNDLLSHYGAASCGGRTT